MAHVLANTCMALLHYSVHIHIYIYCAYTGRFPKLSSCYDEDERYYTQEDAKEVVQYAKNRGIRVIPELDVP